MADNTLKPYTDADMIHVVDGSTGNVMEYPVPKTWIGTDLLPPGSKKATKTQVEKADTVSVEDAGQADVVVAEDSGVGE